MSTLLMVSGASRGLGRAISIAFAQSPRLQADVPMVAVLLARSKVGGLDGTEKEMQLARPSNLTIHGYSVDLGNLDTLEQQVEPIFEKHSFLFLPADDNGSTDPPSTAILINCAGTTGYIGRIPPSLSEIRQAIDLNFTSKAWLTTRFLQQFQHYSNTTVVNVSSVSAIKPTPTMGLYCAASAAREMFHTVLAMDTTTTTTTTTTCCDRQQVANSTITRILNYAPGPSDTDMQAFLRTHESLDPTVQSYCHTLQSEGSIVKVEDTAAELARRVLEPNAFQSGERVEFVGTLAYHY